MNSRCQSYDVDTNTRSGRQKLEKDSIVNYFEKICLRGGKFVAKQMRMLLIFSSFPSFLKLFDFFQFDKTNLIKCVTRKEVGHLNG